MQLRYDQLTAQLQKTLSPVYLLSGTEPLLLEESRRAIHQAAQRQGFSERQSWSVESGFSWSQLLSSAQSLSLFGSQELIEVRCNAAQLNEAAAKVLITYLKQPPSDKILLLITDKLTPAQQKSAWYGSLLKIGTVIHFWPLTGDDLLRWLKQRLHNVKLTTSSAGLQLLAERAEGNLLAIAQEIEKLGLLYKDTTLTLEQIADAVNDNARFDVFALSDAILQGDGQRIIRVLNGLRDTGVEPILILWAITKEIRSFTLIAEQITRGVTLEAALLEQRVWDKRKAAMRQALRRQPLKSWQQLLQRASEIDQLIKSSIPGNIWDELAKLSLNAAGIVYCQTQQ